MSENLDLVRSIFVAAERGDYGSAEWADPEIEIVIADGPAPGRWAGPAGLADVAREFLDAWEGVSFEVDEYRELDSERVVALLRRSGRGKASGVDLGQIRTQGAFLFHVGDDRVTRVVIYWDRENAFADLGLAPRGDAPDQPG